VVLIKRWLFRRIVGKGTPWCMFGELFTKYRWGWDIKCFNGWVVWTGHSLYWSEDATPDSTNIKFLYRKER